MKAFLIEQFLKRVPGIPEDKRKALASRISENPQIFQDIATDAQAYVSQGKTQDEAILLAVKNRKSEIETIFSSL